MPVALPLQVVLFLTLKLTVGHPDPLLRPDPPRGLCPRSLPSKLLLPTCKPPLPPSFSSFHPDPEGSASCSAVQSPESSPSSSRAICSICLCPAHLASCPPGLLPTWPRILGGGFGVAGLGLSFPAPSGAAPWWLWDEGSSYLQGAPSSRAVAFNMDETNKKQKRETQQTQAPVSQMWGWEEGGRFSSPARNTWETHKSNISRNDQWPQIEGKLSKRIVRD